LNDNSAAAGLDALPRMPKLVGLTPALRYPIATKIQTFALTK
jgi:hypothetical protein